MNVFTVRNLVLSTLLVISHNSFADLIPANMYQCKGNNVTVNYSSSSIMGQPQLNITIGKRAYGAMGDKSLQMQQTVLGNLISLVRMATPDLFTDTLTVLLPDVNVSALGESVAFKSQLLITRTNTSIGGTELVNGLIQSNTAKTLNCTATAVVF